MSLKFSNITTLGGWGSEGKIRGKKRGEKKGEEREGQKSGSSGRAVARQKRNGGGR